MGKVEIAKKVYDGTKKFIEHEIDRGEKDAKIIKKKYVDPVVESVLDKGLRESGLTGGFSDWLTWGDRGGRRPYWEQDFRDFGYKLNKLHGIADRGGMRAQPRGGWRQPAQLPHLKDPFPAPSVVARMNNYPPRWGGDLDHQNHHYFNERTLVGDRGGSIWSDKVGLAKKHGTPRQRGYFLEDGDRLREYNTGNIQTSGGIVRRIKGRDSRHEPVLLLPGEVVLTKEQAKAAKKAGARLPTHSLQKVAGKIK